MKQVYFLFLSLFLFSLHTVAQTFTGDGYYRVQNYGTERFIYVTDNTGSYDMNRDHGDFGALQLWKDQSRTISDPASVIYIESQPGGQYDLKAQGIGIYDMVGRYVDVYYLTSGPFAGTYNVYASAAGISKYLCDMETSALPQGTIGTKREAPYRNWNVLAISSDSEDNYFGIKPNVTHGEKHYYPFFADFPFTLKSEGMKAYVISVVDAELGMAVMKEITGVVPASTPVIIECSSTEATNNRLNLEMSAGTAPESNVLKGNFFYHRYRPESKDALVAFDAQTMRMLGVTAEGKLGFVTESASLNTHKGVTYLPANQAYLPVPETAGAELTIVTEEEYEEALKSKVYTITYMLDGETYALQTLKAGETIKPETAPEREGYTFVGWENLPETMPASSITVNAVYTVNIYTVTYIAYGEEVHVDSVAYGSPIPAYTYTPEDPKDIFQGWVGDVYETMPAHNIIYTADIAVGVSAVPVEKKKGIIYDLFGRRIHRILTSGIYIIDGRKVFWK